MGNLTDSKCRVSRPRTGLRAVQRVCPLAGLLALLATVCPCQDRNDFVSDLAVIEKAAAGGQWRVAQRRLDGLLEEHAQAAYFLRERVRIVELARDCAFHLSFPRPRPKDVVSGDLLAYNSSTGRIRIRYGPNNMADFDRSSGTYVHPLVFDGAHSITVKGRQYAGTAPTFVVCIKQDTAYRVRVASSSVRIERREGGEGEWRELAKRVINVGKYNKPFAAQVKVTATSIVLYFDGQLVLRARKERGDFGQSAFVGPRFTEVFIEGNANTAWIQGKIDTVVNAAREKFAKTFDPQKALPQWLFADSARASEPASRTQFPGQLRREERDALWQIQDLIEKGDGEAALEVLSKMDPARAPAARAFLRATIDFELGHTESALRLIEPVCEEYSEFPDARLLRGRIYGRLRDRQGALKEYRAVLELEPGSVDAASHAVVLLLRMNQMDDARRVLADVREAGANDPALDGVERNLLKATRGPSWQRRFESTSRTFSVHSDIDAKASADARNVLETAHVAFQAEFGWLRRGERSDPLRVFLFSGEAGYQVYCRDLWGAARPHTAGLYSPDLKQLLIWNLPDRDMMLRTVRHEGWHQFLDSIMDDPPIWLNEGLAEYFEIAERRGGRFTSAEVHWNHVSFLRKTKGGMPKLATLVSLDRAAFYGNPELYYAQGWAVIHFLRHSTKQNRRVFDDVFEALQDNVSSTQAFTQALGKRTMNELDREFRAYILALR